MTDTGSGITTIGHEAFWNSTSLAAVNIPDTVTSIRGGAFIGCISLKEITIPRSVTAIGTNAFLSCSKITDVFFQGTKEQWETIAIEIGNECLTTANIHFEDEALDNSYNSFMDISANAFYYEPVLWAVENGITNGVDATHFAPNVDCTRAQVVTFLWRAVGSPEPSSVAHPFTDIKSSSFYYKAVLWAVEKGIVNGTSKTTFSPGERCTRSMVATILHRMQGSPDYSIPSNPFVDVIQGKYYYDAVLWAVETGVTTGVDKTRFEPNRYCTRGQIVTFLYRALG